ncbi:MAG TPA: MFS transporter [Pseudonocardiaceae bacterium]|jgi:MFS family permease|nr:MFS transporter [Pseudonocardiaceae bacterium]
MSTTSIDQRATGGSWFRTLGPAGRRAFAGAFGGYGLDAYDFQVLPLGLVAIAAYFHLSTGAAGLLSTVTLVASGVGGALAGILADRIGRVRTLMFTVATYALFTVLCGFAPDYPALLVLRGLQGVGFGGEWAIGAILVAEYALPRYRGRTVGFVQSSWAVGWALAVIVSTLVFSLASPAIAWRVLFFTGALPAVLVFYLRRRVADAPIRQSTRDRGSFRAILGGGLGRTTFFAAALATGVQGGYYTLATWLPTYLKTARHLSVVNTGGYLAFVISGAFLGYVTGGYLTDLFGRKRTFALFAVLSAALIVGYTSIPAGANTAVMLLGFPLGFASSAIYSGFGSFLAELYPTSLRGTGQGFTYNFGRAVGAFFPTVVGFLASGVGIGAAMGFGALGYGIAVLALLGLPETAGRELT